MKHNKFLFISLLFLVESASGGTAIYSYTYNEAKNQLMACQRYASGENFEEWQANVIKHNADMGLTCVSADSSKNKVLCKNDSDNEFYIIGEISEAECIASWKKIAKIVNSKKIDNGTDPACKHLSGFLVSRKLKDHEYEIQAKTGVKSQCLTKGRYGNCTSFKYLPIHESAILLTTETEFKDRGTGSLYVKHDGKRKITLQDGFSKELAVYKEAPNCKPKPTEDKYSNFRWSYFIACGEITKNINDADSELRNLGSVVKEVTDTRLVIKTDKNVIPRYFYKSEFDCESDLTRKK